MNDGKFYIDGASVALAISSNQIDSLDERYEFFRQAGFGDHYQLLIYLFNIDNKYRNYLGSVLKFFADPHVNSLLELWSEVSEEAASFLKFSDFLINGRVCFRYPAINDASPVKEQLKGNLENLYLLALVIERLPLTHKAGKEWHRTMSIWLVLRAIKYAKQRHFDDEYLIDVITRLRMAADENPEALNIVQSLMPSNDQTFYFSEIEAQLENRPLIELKREGLSHTIINFLRSTNRVAKLEIKIHKSNKLSKSSIAPSFNLGLSKTNVIQNFDGFWQKRDDAQGLLTVSTTTDTDEEHEYLYALDQTINTDSKRALSDKTVLLTTTINAQFSLFEPHILSDPEIKSLKKYITQQILSTDEKTKTLAAITYISILISRSLDRALGTKIDTVNGEDWVLNPIDCYLYRLPPKRKSDWKPNESQKNSVKKYVELNKLALPEVVKDVLKERLKKVGTVNTLKDLWFDLWGSITVVFDDLFKHFRHISPSGLSYIYPTTFINYYPDESVTHLIASNSQTGLPASCAYANFKVKDLKTLLAKSFPFELPTATDDVSKSQPSTILFGSSLDVSEEILKENIEELNRRYALIMHSDSKSSAEKHNALTAYVLYMLYASTGGRPIKDPFELLQYFDLDNGILFIDDKMISGDSTGRLVPLPKSLCLFIRDIYLRHLKILANELCQVNPALSFEILQIANQKHTGMMPLFFFIDDTGRVPEWKSVYPKSLTELDLFSSTLPDNLFRHRLAKRLREGGVDPEIIAGILGHVDFGCAPYSFFSHRCFENDIFVARPISEQIFNDLPFNLSSDFHKIEKLRLKTNQFILENIVVDREKIPLYGREARRVAREIRHRAWADEASKDIDFVLKEFGLTFESLKEDHIEILINKMLFKNDGLPRSNRAFRYDCLLKKLEEQSQKNNYVYKFKSRYVTHRPESIFDESAIYALNTFKKIRKALKANDKFKCVSRLNKLAGLQLIPVLLMVETRLSDLKQIHTVLKNNQFCIIQHEYEYFLEISNASSHTSNHPVRRYKISSQCAYLLDKNKKHMDDDVMSQALDDALKYAFNHIANLNLGSYESFLKSLSNIVQQANCLELNGIQAGFLSGKLESYGLLRSDWAYLRFGKHLDFNDSFEEKTEVDFTSVASKACQAYQFEDAKNFIDTLRSKIDINYPNAKSNKRNEVIKNVDTFIKGNKDRVSSALIIFAQWIKNIITNGPRKKYLMSSTVVRYFDTLCKPFLEQLFDQDLFLFDEEDMTDVYSDIINSSKIENQGYVSNRLLEFHRFARQVGVEDPDWNEVPLVALSTKVSPGFIHEHQYLATLNSIYNDQNIHIGSPLQPCMLLILAMRFGLRANEVLGLLKFDYYEIDNQIWIDIKSNYIRNLKRRLSRRKVPLLFKLCKLEQTIVNRFMAEFEAEHASHLNIPLFNKNKKPLDRSENLMLRAYVNFKLKKVTGNPNLSLHHCRHTAANHLSLSLMDIKLKGWKNVGLLSKARAGFIGNGRVSKKLSWLSARYLGHAILETQYKNYIHFIPELVEQYFEPIFSGREKYKFSSERVINLDKLVPAKLPDLGYLAFMPPKPTELTLQTIFIVFKLIGLGHSAKFIADKLNIDITKIEFIFNLVNEHLLHTKLGKTHVDATRFFGSIKQMSWNMLTDQIDTNAEITLNNLLADNVEKFLFRGNENDFVHKHMIGSTRQIILISEASFYIFRLMMDIFKLTKNDFRVYNNKKQNSIDKSSEAEIERIERCLTEINLAEVSRDNIKIPKPIQKEEAKTCKSKFQLDNIPIKGTYISNRVNIVAEEITKNAKSSMELITMLLTTIVYIELNH